MTKIERFRDFIYDNAVEVILYIAIILSISLIVVDFSTNCIIDHDSEKMYNQMEKAVEENKEEIFSLSNYMRGEIYVGNNLTIVVERNKKVEVKDITVYSQYYTLDHNSLKKELEVMYLPDHAMRFCLFVFLFMPILAAVFLWYIIYGVVLFIVNVLLHK